MNERERKLMIWKAILCVVPCLVIFILAQSLLFLLIHLLAGLIIDTIPVLGNLFLASNSVITFFATVVSIFAAYFVTTFIQGKMMKHIPMLELSRIILGVIIATYHTSLLVVNLSEGGYYPINIFCIIASLGFMLLNKDEY